MSPDGWVTEKLLNGKLILEPAREVTPNSSVETFLTQARILDANATCKVSACLRLVGVTSIDGLANVIGAVGSATPGECILNRVLKTAGHAALPSSTVVAMRTAVARLRLEVIKGAYPLLVTAPHSIMLPRDGYKLHRVEVASKNNKQSYWLHVTLLSL